MLLHEAKTQVKQSLCERTGGPWAAALRGLLHLETMAHISVKSSGQVFLGGHV